MVDSLHLPLFPLEWTTEVYYEKKYLAKFISYSGSVIRWGELSWDRDYENSFMGTDNGAPTKQGMDLFIIISYHYYLYHALSLSVAWIFQRQNQKLLILYSYFKKFYINL